MTLALGTVATRAEFAHVRVLSESLARSNPGVELTAVIIDDVDGLFLQRRESFSILAWRELGMSEQSFTEIVATKSSEEVRHCLMPYLLQILIARGASCAIGLAPKSWVLGSLDTIVTSVDSATALVLARTPAVLPDDRHRPDRDDLWREGELNPDFVVVTSGGDRFLDRWREFPEDDDEPVGPTQPTKSALEAASHLVGVRRCVDLDWCLSEWNLHMGDIGFDPATGVVTVNETPLLVLQFTGYDPEVPELFGGDWGGMARILLSERPELRTLTDRYRDRLLRRGVRAVEDIPYAFSRLRNGLPFDGTMKDLARQSFASPLSASTMPSPFENAEHFVSWCTTPGANDRISRYLDELYRSRGDLQELIPRLDVTGAEELVRWCWGEVAAGRIDHRLVPRFEDVAVEIPPRDLPISRSVIAGTQRSATGIEVSGYLRAEMGVGELGRNLVHAVEASGVPFTTRNEDDPDHRQRHPFIDHPGDVHAVNLVCMNADSMVHFAYRMGADYFDNRYTIGVWSWELEEFPEEFDSSFALVDEIWANSPLREMRLRSEPTSQYLHFRLRSRRPVPLPLLI